MHMAEKELKLKPRELQKRVQAYLTRIKETPNKTPSYPLNQVGLWGFVSGWDILTTSGYELEHEIYEGRFIDAVTKFAKLPYGFHAMHEIDESHAGYVTLITIKTLPKSKISIDDLV